MDILFAHEVKGAKNIGGFSSVFGRNFPEQAIVIRRNWERRWFLSITGN